MKQIGRFAEKANNPTMRDSVDPNGSTVDTIFADAILASMPSIVMEKHNLALMKDAAGKADSVTFPVFTNFDLTWNNLTESGSANNGSVISLTAGGTPTFMKATPVLYSAGIFVADVVDLTVNKADFETYSKLAAQQVARKTEQVFFAEMNTMDLDSAAGSYAAGGFTANGSISAASTITPTDLSEAKRSLTTGSDIYVPDVIVMHPNQYSHLMLHQDFSLTNATGAHRKGTWADGNLVKYDGMDIVVSEQVTGKIETQSDTGSAWPVAGHPVYVFKKGLSAGFATKKEAFKVSTVDDRIRHGKFKVFDIMIASQVLVPASIVVLRCAD